MGSEPNDRKRGHRRRGWYWRFKWTVRVAFLLAILGIPIVGLDRLFYYPSDTVYGLPDDVGLSYEDVTFTSSDGLKLSGWFVPARAARPRGTIIHFHGNAANITNHFFASYWLALEGYNVFVFDYRGYGRSEGKPDRAGTIRDGHAALDYVLSRDDVDQQRVFVFGQSLGGAVATVVVAEREEIRAVVLDSTFSNYRRIASQHLQKTLYFRWLTDFIARTTLSGDYEPIDYVAKISPRPLLIVASTQDQICYANLGRELFDAAQEPKQWILLPRGRHLEAVSENVDDVQRRILDFLNAAASETPLEPQ